MPSTTVYRFDDLILVPFPFTDQTAIKKRPAVVVSSDIYNRRRMDLIVMAVTSQRSPPGLAVGDCPIVGWKSAGLPKPSHVKPVLATIERGLVLRKLGELDDSDRHALREALQQVLG